MEQRQEQCVNPQFPFPRREREVGRLDSAPSLCKETTRASMQFPEAKVDDIGWRWYSYEVTVLRLSAASMLFMLYSAFTPATTEMCELAETADA